MVGGVAMPAGLQVLHDDSSLSATSGSEGCGHSFAVILVVQVSLEDKCVSLAVSCVPMTSFVQSIYSGDVHNCAACTQSNPTPAID